MAWVYALQHIGCEPPGRIQDALDAHGIGVRAIRAFAGDPVPRQMGEALGLVVMGGPMGVYDREAFPFLGDELRLIESALKNDRPVLGICLGSQLLATVLGGRVRRGEQKEIGWYAVRLTGAARTDPLLGSAPGAFVALHWHGDVFELPPGADRLAFSAVTENQAFRYGGNAYGFLFHMEVTAAVVREWVKEFAGDLREAGLDAREILAGASLHLANLHRVGDAVFGAWARLVRRVGGGADEGNDGSPRGPEKGFP